MCFSLGASVASALAGAYGGGFVLWFLRSQLGDGGGAYLDAQEAQAGMILGALGFLPALVQFVDANAHARHLGLPCALPRAANATLGYLVVALQPAALAIATAQLLSDGGAPQIALYALAGVVVAHAILCLCVSAPLEEWLDVQVRKLFVFASSDRFPVCAVIHRWFASEVQPDSWFGGSARGLVYFVALSAATFAFVFRALDMVERPATDCKSDKQWCETVGMSMIIGAGVSWATLMAAAAVASTTIAGHTSSVWCLFSLAGFLAAGLVLLRDEDAELRWLLGGGFAGTWVVAFGLVSLCAPRGKR